MTRTIAEGGMGVVYEALQRGSGGFTKVVAVKLIREEYSTIPEFQKNFIGEARLVANLIHTNIVQTYHLGMIGGQYFMVMEYVSGVNLEQLIERQTALGRLMPVDIAAFIISRIARGLTYAHQKLDKDGRPLGIVHRDVTPGNIVLGHGRDGLRQAKITDFGLAKRKQGTNGMMQSMVGTMPYTCPEIVQQVRTRRTMPGPMACDSAVSLSAIE